MGGIGGTRGARAIDGFNDGHDSDRYKSPQLLLLFLYRGAKYHGANREACPGGHHMHAVL